MSGPTSNKTYRRLSRSDREFIQSALAEHMSYGAIADELGKDVSTVSREVKNNSFVCRKFQGVHPIDMKPRGSDTDGPGCALLQGKTHKLCNGCSRLKTSACTRQRHFYDARIADDLAMKRRSSARAGIDLDPKVAPHVFALIQDALDNNLSPAYIAECVEGVDVSAQTIYRWIEKGEGNLCNLDLLRKVKYKKRNHKVQRQSKVVHAKERLYESFTKLSQEEKLSRWEMDTVCGRQGKDEQALLTLLHKPTHFQLAILIKTKTPDEVIRALLKLQEVLGKDTIEELFGLVLTDNGWEFKDEDEIAKIFGEKEGKTRLFYCEPSASNQKGACEKNHVEIRKIIPKCV